MRPRSALFDFNKEIIIGEFGSLLMAYAAAYLASAFTKNTVIISGSIVAGTLSGGTLFWLAARIHNRRADNWTILHLANDVSYFTPGALLLGFLVYDPAIFFASHHLLSRGSGVGSSVILAQLFAFTLFLGGMNGYRALLLKIGGKRL